MGLSTETSPYLHMGQAYAFETTEREISKPVSIRKSEAVCLCMIRRKSDRGSCNPQKKDSRKNEARHERVRELHSADYASQGVKEVADYIA